MGISVKGSISAQYCKKSISGVSPVHGSLDTSLNVPTRKKFQNIPLVGEVEITHSNSSFLARSKKIPQKIEVHPDIFKCLQAASVNFKAPSKVIITHNRNKYEVNFNDGTATFVSPSSKKQQMQLI